MFARCDGCMRNQRMGDIWRRDDHGIHIIPGNCLFVVGGNRFDAGLLAGLLEARFVGIADGDHFCIRAKREAGHVILQGDAAASNYRYADGLHERVIISAEAIQGKNGAHRRRDLAGVRDRPRSPLLLPASGAFHLSPGHTELIEEFQLAPEIGSGNFSAQ